MLPSYFDYIFVHLKQKVRLKPKLSPKVLSTLGPNPIRHARPDLQLWYCIAQRKKKKIIKIIERKYYCKTVMFGFRLGAMTRKWTRKLVTRFGVVQVV